MNRYSWLYLVGVIVTFLLCGIYLNKAHGTETPPPAAAQTNKEADRQNYIWPRVSRSDAPMRVKTAKSCQEYLSICERSCRERGTMFNFTCIGKDFQPFEEHSRCLCADDLYAQQRPQEKEQVQVKQETKQ